MTNQSTQTPPPPAGFWKIRHLAIGLAAVVVIVMLMLRACGSDDAGKEEQAAAKKDMPRQGLVVQIPATQWPSQQLPAQVQPPAPQQPGYGYIAPQQQPGYGYVVPQQQAPQQPGSGYGYVVPQQQPLVQPQAPVTDGGNPWSVQTPRSYGYGQSGTAQWGRTQQQPAPQYYTAPPSAGTRYRPLEEDNSARTASRPVAPPQPQVQGYLPAAPYDRLSGSSFGEGSRPGYPYGGAYPGYYGPGAYGGTYGVPVSPYTPGYPGVGWPGVW